MSDRQSLREAKVKRQIINVSKTLIITYIGLISDRGRGEVTQKVNKITGGEGATPKDYIGMPIFKHK